MKKTFLLICLSIGFIKLFGQIATTKNHAFKMLVVHNTNGYTAGWTTCNYDIEFNSINEELRGLFLSANGKDLKVNIPKRKQKEKFNYGTYIKDEITYRTYEGTDDLTGEDVKILIGYNISANQMKPISVTLIFLLSSNYIALN